MPGGLTEQQWQEIIDRKRAGATVPELVAAYGLKKSSIYLRLRQAGVTANHGSEKGRQVAPPGEAIHLTPEQLADLMERVKRCLRRYQDHPEFDDLLAEGYLQMWQALRSTRIADLRSLSGLAVRAARNGAGMWMSSTKSGCRRRNHEGKPLPFVESLERLMDEARESPERARRLPIQPDFAPALVERLYALWLWERGAEELLGVEREIVARTVLAGEEPAEVGAAFGLSQSRVYQIRQTALNRFRRQLGLPLKNDGTTDYLRHLACQHDRVTVR
jgi:RNA polymerase sigma factor (sigma-70 family)